MLFLYIIPIVPSLSLFFWIKSAIYIASSNDVVKVFRRGQDIRDYYKLKYSPLNRVIVENLLHEHPGVKLLF